MSELRTTQCVANEVIDQAIFDVATVIENQMRFDAERGTPPGHVLPKEPMWLDWRPIVFDETEVGWAFEAIWVTRALLKAGAND